MSTLKGNLQSISLMDVVQLLHANRKTGKLYVNQGKQEGTLFVQNGEVVHAENPPILGESAAFEILEWDKGEFEFMACKFTCPTSIRRSVPDLLMEAARTSDSRKHLKGIFPNLHAVPWPTIPMPDLVKGVKLFAEDKRVIPFLDGYRTFLEVMAGSEQSEVAVLQTARLLKEAKRLVLLDPAIHLTVRPLKTGFFKKADHVELSSTLEAKWKGMGPYGAGPIANVRIVSPEGPAVTPVAFVKGLDEKVVAIPKELMQSWNLPEGIFVSVRPAP